MHRILLAGLLSVLFAVPGAAQESPIVSEAEFLSALDASHPAVAETSEAVYLARARILAASTHENPVLEVVREDPDGPSEQMEWALSWQLPGAGRIVVGGQAEGTLRGIELTRHILN